MKGITDISETSSYENNRRPVLKGVYLWRKVDFERKIFSEPERVETCLIDSGCNRTRIPEDTINLIAGNQTGTTIFRDIRTIEPGTEKIRITPRVKIKIWRVDITIARGLNPVSVWVTRVKGKEGIIGRDVLNNFCVILDGRHRQVHVGKNLETVWRAIGIRISWPFILG